MEPLSEEQGGDHLQEFRREQLWIAVFAVNLSLRSKYCTYDHDQRLVR